MGYILRVKPDNEEIKLMYEKHNKFHEGDDGLDLLIPEDIVIPGGKFWESFEINHKICCEMYGMIPLKAPQSVITQIGQQPGYVLQPYNVGYYLLPRSSIVKTPLIMANHIGLVDSNYRGNIKAFVRNLSGEDYLIEKGTRLFQITTKDSDDFVFHIVGELTETARGTGGFGSTGV